MRTHQIKKSTLMLGLLAMIIVIIVIAFAGEGAQIAYAAQSPVYTYQSDGMVFESVDSTEDAWQQAMTYQYEQGLMTLAEVQMLFEDRLIYN